MGYDEGGGGGKSVLEGVEGGDCVRGKWVRKGLGGFGEGGERVGEAA